MSDIFGFIFFIVGFCVFFGLWVKMCYQAVKVKKHDRNERDE